jgi:MFS family permease
VSDLSLSPRAFRAVLLVLGLLGPLPFLADVARHPLELVPCGPPPGGCQLGDAAIATSVLGRAWSRFERGEAWNRDDRVFAPYPDSWGLSEGYLAEAIVGYPWARLSGSPAAGYNVAYALACVFAFWSAGALFLRLAGPGWPALVGALLFTWSQGRLNSVGVLSVLWAGLVPLAIAFGLDVLRRGRWRDALLFGATWLAIGMGSLSGLLMGAITAGLVLAACGLVQPARRRRLPLLLVAGAVAAFPLVLVHRPLFRLARDFDVKVSMRTFEGQSADLASLLHHSGFSVPLKAVFDGLLPGFPPGSPGFFPGLFALTVGGLWLLLPRVHRPVSLRLDPACPETDIRLWGALAIATFLFALGPTIHLLGRPLLPGPWRLFTHVPVFSSMRGLFRWDQWFSLAVTACVVLSLAATARHFRSSPPARVIVCALIALLAVDVWPRPIVASALPGPSPFQDVLQALDRDAIVAVYPFERATSERAWVEQLFHGRRVLNGFQSFPTPVHFWLDAVSHTRPPSETLAIYRELGASAIDVDLASVPALRRRETRDACETLLSAGEVRHVARGDRILLLLPPLTPLLVDPLAFKHLSFDGKVARLEGVPGRLMFRLRSGALPVRIESGSSSFASLLRIPLVGAGSLTLRLDNVPPPGARILDASRDVEIGVVVKGHPTPETPPSTAVPPPRTSTRSARSPTP